MNLLLECLGPVSCAEEFLGCLGRRVDLPINEESSRVRSPGCGELPRHRVPLAGKLGPLRVLGGILLQPEVTMLVRKAAQAGVSEPIRPGLDIRQDCHRSSLSRDGPTLRL